MSVNGHPVTRSDIAVIAVVALWAWGVGFGMGMYAAKIGFLETKIEQSRQ